MPEKPKDSFARNSEATAPEIYSSALFRIRHLLSNMVDKIERLLKDIYKDE